MVSILLSEKRTICVLCLVIINKTAARARGAWPIIEPQLKACGPYELYETTAPGDATTRTRDALRTGAKTIVVVGGDGTLSETAEGYMLELEMPGVNKDGLEISIENNELSIVGRRSNPAIDGALVHRESRSHNFRRSFEMDPSIDHGKISARINQGIVTLTLPKAEQVKPRKIAVS